MRTASLLAIFVLAAACGGRGCSGQPPGRPQLVKRGGGDYYLVDKGAWKGYYDASGRLAIVEYDSTGRGRPNHIAHYDELRRIRLIEVDEDLDGWVDRFEYYDAAGRLEKVGRCRKQRGRADEWTFRGPDGHASRIEYDDDGDGKAERALVIDHGLVVRIELDSDRDGKYDRFQTWTGGRLEREEIDLDGDGKPDRALVFGKTGQLLRMERLTR